MAEHIYEVVPNGTFGGEAGTLMVEWVLATGATGTGKPFMVAGWDKIMISLSGSTVGTLRMEGSLENHSETIGDFSKFFLLRDAGDPASPVDAAVDFETSNPPNGILIHEPLVMIRPNANGSLTGALTVRMLLVGSSLRR